MEYKHFSHPHYLTFQTLQKGPEIQCSGCKYPASGDTYICWQCSFFLHEQCFKASRALNHHSHSSHPLTLFPYPTYPSASFICNSCHQTGTGFSFSCSHCEFDLHVHCAYNPHTQTTPIESSSTYPYHVPTQNYSPAPNENPTFHSQFPFPPPISTHESPFPGIPNQTHWSSNSTHEPCPDFPKSNPQYPPYIPQNANYDPLFNDPHVQPPNQTVPSFNPQMGAENPNHRPNPQHHGPNQTPPSFNAPVGPHLSAVHQPFQNISNAQHPPPYKTVPSFDPHMGPENMTQGPHPQYPIPNQTPSSFNAPPHQSAVHQPFQNVPSFDPQTQPAKVTQEPVLSRPNSETQSNTNKPTNVSGNGQNQQKLNRVKHFSHQHALLFSNIKEEDRINCSGCEQKVSGSAYTCTMSKCNFNLHNSCFGLPRELKHKSHPEHSLTLLSSPPYDNEYNQYACNACLENGGAFVYHCSTCNYDLHVDCAFLPERIKRGDHEHVLSLLYSFPFKKVKEDDPELIFTCDVCRATVDQHCWFYYCQDCDFGTHLGCIAVEQIPQEEPSEAVSELTAMLETQAQLQRLQLEMQMATQTAQMMVSMGQSLSNLAG